MTAGFALKIFFEIGLIFMIAYGYKNEQKLIAFERELFAVLKFAFKKYVLHKTPNKKANAQRTNMQRPANVEAHKTHRAEVRRFPVERTNRSNNVA